MIHVFAGHPFSLSKWPAQDWAAQQKITCHKALCQSHREGHPQSDCETKPPGGGRVTTLELHTRLYCECSVAFLLQRCFFLGCSVQINCCRCHAHPQGEMRPSHLPTLPWQLSCLLGVTHAPFPAEQGNYTGFHTTSSKLMHSSKNPQFCKAGFLQQTCQ